MRVAAVLAAVVMVVATIVYIRHGEREYVAPNGWTPVPRATFDRWMSEIESDPDFTLTANLEDLHLRLAAVAEGMFVAVGDDEEG